MTELPDQRPWHWIEYQPELSDEAIEAIRKRRQCPKCGGKLTYHKAKQVETSSHLIERWTIDCTCGFSVNKREYTFIHH